MDRQIITANRSAWKITLLLVVIVIGATLRLVWPEDIEFKLDEAWTFHQATHWSEYENPWLGMSTSQGFRNPGMSLWIFAIPTQLFGWDNPVQIAQFVQWSNILAILLLGWFAWRWVPGEEREPWLWAVALVCFNPLSVLFQRKIWPPSVIPLLSVLLLMSWWKRETRCGAFFWGLLAAVIAQIHLGGVFSAAGIWLWTWLFRRDSTNWKFWFLGSILGTLPAIPWLLYLMNLEGGTTHTLFSLSRWFEFKFWGHWFTEPFGIGLKYSLTDHHGEFLQYPLIGGKPTFLVLLFHIMTWFLLVTAVLFAVRQFWRSGLSWSEQFSGNGSSSRLLVYAGLFGYGVIFTLSAQRFYRHYLIVTFPLMYVWAAFLILRGRELSQRSVRIRRTALAFLCFLQLATTGLFLSYIHEKGGAPKGDYQYTYRVQKQLGKITRIP